MRYVPKTIEGNVNVSPGSPLGEFFYLFFALILILLVVYFTLGFAVDLVAERAPAEFEDVLGKMFARRFDEQQSKEERYLQRVLDNLMQELPSNEQKYTVHLVESELINAFAFPGGHIAVHRGLVKNIESENGLAMVLAHELGHFANRDHMRGLGRGLVLVFLSQLLFGADSQFIYDIVNPLGDAVNAKFSREQEAAADRFGLDLLQKTYGHVAGSTEFFEKLEAQRERLSEHPSSFFSTHPLSAQRIREVKRIVKDKGFARGKKAPLRWSK